MKLIIIFSSLFLLGCTKSSTQETIKSATTSLMKYGKVAGYKTTLHYIHFNQNQFHIELADQPNGPASLWQDAKSAAQAHGAVAAINAGFFNPEGKPIVLCIDDGKKTGYLNTSSLGSGALIIPKDKKPILTRRVNFSTYRNPQHLLQSGPFLVEKGNVISVKASDVRPRAFIAWDGKEQWVIGHIKNITMQDMATWLGSSPIDGFSLVHALNLDGGRSCQFYIDEEVAGEETQITTLLNRKVRNFLVVKAK